MWTLDTALLLIRAIQPNIKHYGYHVALGGGVLNQGQSQKDLDLYFLLLSETSHDATALVSYFSMWGNCYNLGGSEVLPDDVLRAYPPDPTWINGRYTYRPNGKRIDVFIA